MFLAGIPIPENLILELARLVDDEQLEVRLRFALAREVKVLALEEHERHTIIRALEDAPEGLLELRSTLLQDHTWRQRERL